MYIRRKKNKSGSSSVFIVDESRGKYHVIKHFGVGKTEEDLILLEQRASLYLLEVKGLSYSLFEKKTSVLAGNFVSQLSTKQLRLIGPELVYGRLFDKIGFGRLHNEMFRHLVIAHLFSPNSKVKTIDYLQRFIGKNHGINSIYRFLDSLCWDKTTQNVNGRKEIRKEIEKTTFDRVRKMLNERIQTVFCHLIPLRFEASGEELPRKMLSGDKKSVFPQFCVALLTDPGCNPIGYELFEEKTLQDNSFITSIQHLSKRFELPRPIVIADAALLSKHNISGLREAHYEYILCIEPKNEPEDTRQRILNLALKDGEMSEIAMCDYRLIVSNSPVLATKERLKRERGLKRLRQKIKSELLSGESINNRGYNKYLKLKGKTKVIIDHDKCRIDAVWDGITGCYTNSTSRPDEIMAYYNTSRINKQAFRMHKSDLLIQPVYHGIQNRIEALVCICFTAYTIMMELDRQLKASGSAILLKRAQEITNTLYRLAYSEDIKKHTRLPDKQQAELCAIVENAVIG